MRRSQKNSTTSRWITPTLRIFVLLAAFSLGPAVAQGINARLFGTVLDPSGAVIKGASIKLRNIETGIVLTTTSNDAGVYEFPSLQPGPYRLEGESSGFQPKTYERLILQVAGQVREDLPMEIAPLRDTVQVNPDLESPVAAGTASVGTVIDGDRIQDLPVAARDALSFPTTQAGVGGAGNFDGGLKGWLNTSVDGIITTSPYSNNGIFNPFFLSTDLVRELRVVTSPADAELGRGSGQIMVATRSGTNDFHGSLFDTHRNTALNANTWFNNLNGVARNVLIRNQFGGRLGGPVIRNKTFFFFLYDGQREVTKNSVTSTTYTSTARQGVFRFFPGVQNGNFNATVPVVDILGNPVKPASALGDLQSINLFSRDPNRPVIDPSGTVQDLLSVMPLPNNYRVGDGLNTAGYTWGRRATSDRDQFTSRIDHQFNTRFRLSFNWTHEKDFALNGSVPPNFPDVEGAPQTTKTDFYSFNMTMAISPRILNEFHAGSTRAWNGGYSIPDMPGNEKFLGSAGGIRYVPMFIGAGQAGGVNNVFNGGRGATNSGAGSPLTVWGDNLSWNVGRHTLKVGGEARFSSLDGYGDGFAIPQVSIGTGSQGVNGIINIPNVVQNQNAAQNLLINLSGSVSQIQQDFYLLGAANPTFFAPSYGQHAHYLWHARDFGIFMKDDWKIKANLTLNLGLRYEYYGVPWTEDWYTHEGNTAGIAGGSQGLFGWSGTSLADLYRPGPQKAELTALELVGPKSPNPDKQLYNDDWNNVAPAVGLSWSIPYFGEGKTVLRAGYSVGYERFALQLLGNISALEPGLRKTVTATSSQSSPYLDLTNLSVPLTPSGKPMEVAALTDRTEVLRGYDSNLRTPYVQNWNLTVQHELPRKMSIDVRYVGTKGTKLVRQTNINEVNIIESGVLDAFLVTQAGGNAPLLDQMLSGLTVNAGSNGTLGQGVVGTTTTGSAALRQFSTTRSFFQNNNVGGFANYLNTTDNFTQIRGGLLRRAGLPENQIVANPQYQGVWLAGNFSNSTHHALQIEFNKRTSRGLSLQSSYTWGRTIGEGDPGGEGPGTFTDGLYRNFRNRHLDKHVASFNRTHSFRANGVYELPFGPGRRILGSGGSILSRLVEKWQMAGVLNLSSGLPISFTSPVSSFNQSTANTPDLLTEFPKDFGEVTFDSRGVLYFTGLQVVPDPTIATLTSQQSLNSTSNLKALAQNGKLIAANPKPGTVGNMNQAFFEGPGLVRLDMNLVKRIRIAETKELEFRVDAINLLNHTNFSSPDANINSTTFGRITSSFTDNRIIELHARFNF